MVIFNGFILWYQIPERTKNIELILLIWWNLIVYIMLEWNHWCIVTNKQNINVKPKFNLI